MRATIPIAVQPGTKLLRMYHDVQRDFWILWLFHDLQMTNGTFLRLNANGTADRVTLSRDGTETIDRIA